MRGISADPVAAEFSRLFSALVSVRFRALFYYTWPRVVSISGSRKGFAENGPADGGAQPYRNNAENFWGRVQQRRFSKALRRKR